MMFIEALKMILTIILVWIFLIGSMLIADYIMNCLVDKRCEKERRKNK